MLATAPVFAQLNRRNSSQNLADSSKNEVINPDASRYPQRSPVNHIVYRNVLGRKVLLGKLTVRPLSLALRRKNTINSTDREVKAFRKNTSK